MKRLAVLLILASIVCITRGARANGRFPRAQMMVTAPGSDGRTVYLRTTFGILVSRDAGESWSYVCERAFGYQGTWDPPIAVTRDGTLWVGLEDGLASSPDGGCTVTRAPALAGESVEDLTTDARGETLWAITGSPTRRNAVWRKDSGEPFVRTGFAPEAIHLMTIEVGPAKRGAKSPSRVYVTGQPYGSVRGRLYRSTDGGRTFKGDENELKESGPLFIAEVDPKDADRVVLRHLHTHGSDVLVTKDGQHFEDVLSMKSAMFGFAKSEDGETLWAGSGLAKDGIWRSTDRGAHFTRVSHHGVLCLHAASKGRLFVCENPRSLSSPVIAVSSDGGATVKPIAGFDAIRGPVACDGGGSLCDEAWKATRAQLTPAPPKDAGAPDAGAAKAPKSAHSTCGCRVPGGASSPDLAWLMAGLAPLAVWARARARRGSGRAQVGRGSST